MRIASDPQAVRVALIDEARELGRLLGGDVRDVLQRDRPKKERAEAPEATAASARARR